MLSDRVSNPGPLSYESGTLSTALHGPARGVVKLLILISVLSGVDKDLVWFPAHNDVTCTGKGVKIVPVNQ